MARRVNTQFVVILGGSVLVLAVGAALVAWHMRHRTADPTVLLKQAEQAEKDQQLEKAIKYYAQAANTISGRHGPGADVLYAKVAELYHKASLQSKDVAEGVLFYQKFEDALDRALVENPRNLEVNQRVIRERYQRALLEPSAARWESLDGLVTRFLGNLPKATAEFYEVRADARLHRTQLLTTSDIPESTFTAIEKDIAQAAQIEPDSGKPVSLGGDLFLIRATRAQSRGALADATRLLDTLEKDLRAFLEKHPNDPDVVRSLFDGLRFRGKYKEALDLVKPAFDAHPASSDLGERLCLIYGMNSPSENLTIQPELIEKVYKQLVAAEPDSAQAYYRLGRFYQARHQTQDSINAFKECMMRAKGGGGLVAIKNGNYLAHSYYDLAWLYMDLAANDGIDTEKGKASLAESATYTEKLKLAISQRGLIDLLQGRTQFIRSDFAQANSLLQNAEANLSDPGQQELLCQAKLLLAQINLNLSPRQLGLALKYLEEALTLQPSNPLIAIERVRVLNMLARFSDAQLAAQMILKKSAAFPPEITDEAKRQLAAALAGSGHAGEGRALLGQIDSVAAKFQLATTLLSEGNSVDALVVIDSILEQTPEDINALRLKVTVLVGLNRKDDAIKTVDAAIAKYPKNDSLRILRAALTRVAGGTLADQEQLLASIGDEYVKQIQLSVLYHQQGQYDKEIAALEAARATLGGDGTGAEQQQRRNEIIDRLFNAAISGAARAEGDGAAQKFFEKADSYVRAAEKYKIDGADGKLYRGRLEFMRSKGENGLQTLEQAVAMRQDYALGHKFLGAAYVSKKRYDAALDEFRQALKIIPNDIGVISSTIALLLNKGDPASRQEAQKLLRDGQAIARTDPRLTPFGDLIGDRSTAIAAREAILKARPGDADNVRNLAKLYVAKDANGAIDPKNLDKALKLVQPLVDKDKTDLDSVNVLARIYLDADRADDGIKCFQPALNSTDPKIQYQALLLYGEYCKSVAHILPDRKRIEAVIASASEAFQAAAKIQPEEDEAERHLGDLYFDQEDFTKAEASYQSALAKTPKNARSAVLLRLVECQVRAGKFDAAEQLLNKEVFAPDIFDKLPQSQRDEGLVLRAFSRIQQHRFAEAITELDKVIAANRSSSDALYYRALAQYAMKGNYSQAINDLIQIRDGGTNPGTVLRTHILLAHCYRESQRYAEAVNEYQAIIEQFPAVYPYRIEYATYLRSLSEVWKRLSPGASDEFANNIRRIKPTEKLRILIDASIKYFRNSGSIELESGWRLMDADLLTLQDSPLEAQQIYEYLYRLMPDNFQVTNSYLGSLLQTKNYEEVISISSKVIEKHPEVLDFHLRRAKAYVAIQKKQEAVNDVSVAFELCISAAKQGDGRNYLPFLSLLDEADKIISPEGVVERMRVRLGADPEDALSGVVLAHCLGRLKQYAEAAKVADSFHVPPSDRILTTLLLRQSAAAHYQAKNYEGAAKSYTALLAIDPRDVAALNNYAFLLADNLNKPKEAIPLVERALKDLKANPDPGVYVAHFGNLCDTYGWAKSLAGDIDGAIPEFRRSLQAQPEPLTYYHYAQTLRKAKPPKLADAMENLDLGIKQATATKDPLLPQLEELRKDIRNQITPTGR